MLPNGIQSVHGCNAQLTRCFQKKNLTVSCTLATCGTKILQKKTSATGGGHFYQVLHGRSINTGIYRIYFIRLRVKETPGVKPNAQLYPISNALNPFFFTQARNSDLF